MNKKCRIELLSEWNQIKSEVSNKNTPITQLFVDSNNYELVDNKNLLHLEEYKDYKQAAHAFIWCVNDNKFWDHDCKACVMMQLRFDGVIGFPGGYIDPDDETIEDGLNRELKEELNLSEKYFVTNDDYSMTHVLKNKNMLLHFYIKLVTYEQFGEIEATCLNSGDWGGEVMGIIRPPLYKIYNDKYDGGLPRFIKNKFVGNALYQFLMSLLYTGIMGKDELLEVILHNI